MDLKNISQDIKGILEHIKENPKLEQQASVLKQVNIDIKNLDTQVLKSNVSNSGVFLESKLNTATPTITKVNQDLKAVLLQVQDNLDNSKVMDTPKEVKQQIDRVLTQIDYYQLSSFAADSNKTYLPFEWENSEDCDIEFKSNGEKNTFSCNINLALKEHGDINVMLLLDKNNNININMNVQKDEFKTSLQDNMQLLRQNISNIGLSLQSLNILDIIDEKNKTYEQKAYGANNKHSFGVDIQA